uniref:Predicted protein n=1 Tax=Hordeum vulgare subsp. vulgare TaxID=112509 RepID=F2E585_HORVV|nr:predicted protein [Hordeum vulgare subsp. vulgare]
MNRLTTKIGIVGGGVGGLTLAHCLRRVGFTNVHLYERASQWKDVGAGFSIQCGREVLKYIGLHDRFRDRSHQLTHFKSITKTGETYMELDFNPDIGPWGVSRPAFINLLSSSLPEGVIHKNKTFQSYEDLNDKVKINFADGTHDEVSLLVGCDGVKSKVREQMQRGSESKFTPKYSGHSIFFSISKPNLLEQFPEQRNTIQQIATNGTITGHFPVEDGRFLFYMIHPSTSAPQESWDLEGAKDELAKLSKDAPAPFAALLEHAERIIHLGMYDHLYINEQPWSQGKVVLLGDAAHTFKPHLGQGANQSMEDALCLSRILAQEDTVSKAFDRFEKERKPKVWALVSAAIRVGKLELSTSGFAAFIRKKVLPPIFRYFDVFGKVWARTLADSKKEVEKIQPYTVRD